MDIKTWVEKNFKKGERVLVTGSTSGIGYHYAKTFASLGCDLICVSNEQSALEQTKQEFVNLYKIDVINECVDLSDIDASVKVANKLKGQPIRVLVNNAGIGIKGRFESNDIEKYIDIVKVNAIAPMVLLHALLPRMQNENSGFIINVASINALSPIPNNQVYTATKAFIASMVSAVERENKNSNIQFQLVLPGTTDTPFHVRQGVKPKKLTMQPQDVVAASLNNVSSVVCIPNKFDKVVPMLMRILPRRTAIDIAGYMLKKRLGL